MARYKMPYSQRVSDIKGHIEEVTARLQKEAAERAEMEKQASERAAAAKAQPAPVPAGASEGGGTTEADVLDLTDPEGYFARLQRKEREEARKEEPAAGTKAQMGKTAGDRSAKGRQGKPAAKDAPGGGKEAPADAKEAVEAAVQDGPAPAAPEAEAGAKAEHEARPASGPADAAQKKVEKAVKLRTDPKERAKDVTNASREDAGQRAGNAVLKAHMAREGAMTTAQALFSSMQGPLFAEAEMKGRAHAAEGSAPGKVQAAQEKGAEGKAAQSMDAAEKAMAARDGAPAGKAQAVQDAGIAGRAQAAKDMPPAGKEQMAADRGAAGKASAVQGMPSSAKEPPAPDRGAAAKEQAAPDRGPAAKEPAAMDKGPAAAKAAVEGLGAAMNAAPLEDMAAAKGPAIQAVEPAGKAAVMPDREPSEKTPVMQDMGPAGKSPVMPGTVHAGKAPAVQDREGARTTASPVSPARPSRAMLGVTSQGKTFERFDLDKTLARARDTSRAYGVVTAMAAFTHTYGRPAAVTHEGSTLRFDRDKEGNTFASINGTRVEPAAAAKFLAAYDRAVTGGTAALMATLKLAMQDPFEKGVPAAAKAPAQGKAKDAAQGKAQKGKQEKAPRSGRAAGEGR